MQLNVWSQGKTPLGISFKSCTVWSSDGRIDEELKIAVRMRVIVHRLLAIEYAESEKETKEMFQKWKSAMEKKRLHINMNKMKVMSGKGERKESGQRACSICTKNKLKGIKFHVGNVIDGVTRGVVVSSEEIW